MYYVFSKHMFLPLVILKLTHQSTLKNEDALLFLIPNIQSKFNVLCKNKEQSHYGSMQIALHP